MTTNAAIIDAELVDVRNVGLHKCIKLTLHIPAERAAEVMAAFGWPTGVNPVPVALARLDLEAKEVVPAESRKPSTDTTPASASPGRTSPTRAHKPVAVEKRLTQRAAILCTDPLFHAWLRETNTAWRIMRDGTDEDRAAAIVRAKCNVKSRTEIVPGTAAADIFDDIVSQFTAWKMAPEMAS